MKINLFAIMSIALLGVIGFVSFTDQHDTTKQPTLAIPDNIDYYLKNTLQKSFKTDGTIDFKLTSNLLEHYKKEDKSLMLNPDITVERNNTWQISAQRGDFLHPKEIITFKQNVLLDKLNKINPFKVSANALLFNIKQDLVISESSVKVDAESWTLKAKTMSLDMNSEVHQFTNVTARYRDDKNT